jgi:hemoglobin
MTAYERLGGEAAIAALLEGLYTRGLADPELATFLQDIDMARLRSHQFAFISQVSASRCDAIAGTGACPVAD